MGVEVHRKWSACLRVDCCCRGREEQRTTGSRLQMEPCASGGGFGGAVLVCEVLFCSVAAHSTAPVRRLNSRFTSTCPSRCVQIPNRIGNPLVARSDFSSHINALGTLRSRLKCAKSQCRSAAEPCCNGPLRGFAERQIQRATAVCKAGSTCSCWGWLRRCSRSKHGSHRCDSCRRFVSRCGKDTSTGGSDSGRDRGAGANKAHRRVSGSQRVPPSWTELRYFPISCSASSMLGIPLRI